MFYKRNIRKFVLFLLGIIFIAYGAGTALLIIFSGGDLKPIMASNSASVDQEKHENLNSIKEINIEVSSSEVNIIQEKREGVRAHLAGSITSSSKTNKPTLETYVDGTNLNIKVRTQNGPVGITLYRSMSLHLDVYVPTDYADNLKIKSSSGDINIADAKIDNLNCNLSSGKLTLGKIFANTFSYDSSSGSLTADEVITGTSDLRVSSGEIKIEKFEGDLRAKASSGNIAIKYSKFDNDAEINVSSGSIELSLPEDSEFKLTAKASSGDVTCEFPISVTEKKKDNFLEGVVKNNKNKVVINSSSGDISILK